jgi:hypothetical protein
MYRYTNKEFNQTDFFPFYDFYLFTMSLTSFGRFISKRKRKHCYHSFITDFALWIQGF